MGLVSAYVNELTLQKNHDTFDKRMDLLKEANKENYDKSISDICMYQLKIQEELMR